MEFQKDLLAAGSIRAQMGPNQIQEPETPPNSRICGRNPDT